MNPVRLGAKWSPALRSRRPYMGQAQVQTDIVTILVYKDGKALSGVPIEIMFQNGESKTGTTDTGGTFVSPYSKQQRGQAVVRITPPEDVQDLGEGAAKGVELNGGPMEVSFAVVGVSSSPLVGLGIAGAIYGLVLAVI